MNETEHVFDERSAILTLHDLFGAVRDGDSQDDVIQIAARCLVHRFPAARVSVFCPEGSTSAVQLAVAPGYCFRHPDCEVEQRLWKYVRLCSSVRGIVVIDPEKAGSFLPSRMREKRNCLLHCSMPIFEGERRIGMLSVFFDPRFHIDDIRKSWLHMYADGVSAFVSQRHSMMPAEDKMQRSVSVESGRVADWLRLAFDSPRIKAIVGLRGSGKAALLHAIRGWLLYRGVEDDHTVMINFQEAASRHLKCAEDVMAYLDSFPKSDRPYYLFLNEIAMISWHTELLRLLQGRREWNVWLAASTAHVLQVGPDGYEGEPLMLFRVWPGDESRPANELERIWSTIFIRDVVSGVDHLDIRARELFAEYCSDNIGVVKSLREVEIEMSQFGRSLSVNSIRAHRRALVEAYLIEFSEIYDVVECEVIGSAGGRVFWTDLELRNWRYNVSPQDEPWRLALNRLYLQLRKTYDRVYTPRGADADFLTLEPDGTPKLWCVPGDRSKMPDRFRLGHASRS